MADSRSFKRLQLKCWLGCNYLKALPGAERSTSRVALSCGWQVDAGCWQEAPSSSSHGPFHRLYDCPYIMAAGFPTMGDPGEKEPCKSQPFYDLVSEVTSITLCDILFFF